MSVFWSQFSTLMGKNLILSRRALRATLVQLLVPFLFIFLLWVLKLGIEANDRNKEAISIERDFNAAEFPVEIPRCIPGPEIGSCLTVAWTSNDRSVGDAIMGRLREDQGFSDADMAYFPTRDDMDAYIDANLNATGGAYVIDVQPNPNVTVGAFPGKQISYAVQYNKTEVVVFGEAISPEEYLLAPMQYAIQRAIARAVLGNDTAVRVEEARMPRPELVPTDVVGEAGPTFFFGALMFNFVIQLGQIVNEKENKLREGMRVMGLQDGPYWLSWLVLNSALNHISVWVLVASGAMFQFRFFLRNDFGTYFFLFALFAQAMVPFTFLLSTMVYKARTANSIGFFFFLLGFIAIAFAPLVFEEGFINGQYKVISYIVRFLPFMLFGSGMAQISEMTESDTDPGMRWSDRGSNAYFSLEDTYGWLILDFFVLLLLALYLDNVLPSEFGRTRPLLYFASPKYWRGEPAQATAEETKAAFDSRRMPPNVEADVLAPKEVILQDPASGQSFRSSVPIRSEDREVRAEDEWYESGAPLGDGYAIGIRGINKTFQKRSFCMASGKPFYAVRRLAIRIPNGSLFGLLGHNGAGKSTLINMLTGLLTPTWGDAEILGFSVVDQVSQIRARLGVCPQHDILWGELTGAEHLRLYSKLRGFTGEDVEKQVRDRLADVNLTDAANIQSQAYSGGMKRRLSTAIAFIGDPQIVILDEPTTGMDTVARRQVWDLIQRKKEGRCIILTTHSMEEANVLSDRCGIMAAGRFVTLGTTLRLKSEFGGAYEINVVLDSLDQSVANKVAGKVARRFEGLNPTPGHQPGSLIYHVARGDNKALHDVVSYLEAVSEELGIVDIQVAMSSLESIFVRVSDMAEGANMALPGGPMTNNNNNNFNNNNNNYNGSQGQRIQVQGQAPPGSVTELAPIRGNQVHL